jgi:allantoate deiminase
MTATTILAAAVMKRADALSACTDVGGEITRPYGSPALVAAAAMVADWMQEAGLETRRDAVGNVIGRRGRRGSRPFVLASHIDSVRNAGRYDGPLGVLVAIAAVERLTASELALEVIAFADEEGMRFRSSYLASRAWAGLLTDDDLSGVDDAGVPIRDAVTAMGGDPDSLAAGSRSAADLVGYLEVHIEQGPVLEAENAPVGVVTAIAGQSRGFVELVGRAGHAGNTPPHLRCDALLGAAELILAVEAEMATTPGLIATVGRIDNEPNIGNVISGVTTVSYDVRHQDDIVREAAVERLHRRAVDIAGRRRLGLGWRQLQDHRAVPMSVRLRARLRAAIEGGGLPVVEIASGAGHDAVSAAELTAEVAMLFVRCRGGISHHPDELVAEADVAVAIDVVTDLLHGLEPAAR